MLQLILVFLTSFIVVLYATPALIKVAILKRLIDSPSEERKIHKRSVPTIGGIIIYAGTLFSFSLWYNIDNLVYSEAIFQSVKEFQLIVACSLILFFVGVKDDIIGTAPVKKLFAHIVVALILVLMGDLRITGLHGIFGVDDIPYWGSVFLSIFTYVVVVNAFNLIDGVDGLAAGIGFLASCVFGLWFIFANYYPYAALAFALAGALGGFLIFNFSPAKIFMGDSGSLIIGMFISVIAFKLIEFPVQNLSGILVFCNKPVITISALSYPLLDTLRVFIIRAIKGQSPFAADRNHIHHMLLDCGYSHSKTVIIIYLFTLLNVCITFISVYFYMATLSLLTTVVCSLIFLFIVLRIRNTKKRKKLNHV